MFKRKTLLGLVASCWMTSSAGAASVALRAGFATADLTPPTGLEMGGFGYNLERTGDSVHDHILARVAVLDLNGLRMAIVGSDLGGVRLEVTQEIRRLVQEATAIPGSRVMVGATHSHSTPVVAKWLGVGRVDDAYLKTVPGKIAGAIISAAGKLQRVTMAYGEAQVEGVARNREYKDGPIDRRVRVLRFNNARNELAGFIANYSVHPVVMSEQTRMITGDLTGVATNKVMEQHGGAIGIFLQGSCGDINPVHAHMPPEESLEKLELLASRLAGSMEQALSAAEPVSVTHIDMEANRISLPLVPPDKFDVIERMQSAERWLKIPNLPLPLEWELRYRVESARAVLERFQQAPLDEKSSEVQAALLGDVLVLANPGETFLTFAQQAMEKLKPHRVMVTGYVNDYVGYIPAPDRFDLNPAKGLSYPAYLTPWINGEFRFREDVGDVLVQAMVNLAEVLLRRNGS